MADSRGRALNKPKLKPLACPTLLMGYSGPNNLKETDILLSVKEPETIYPSESLECKKTLEFEEESKKLDHKRKELVKQFNCNLCNAEYTLKENLQKHIESFHDGKRYDCTICDKSLTLKGNLKYHVESIHKGNVPPFQREDKGKNETGFDSQSICSEIELKIEPGSDKSESIFLVNPWDVSNASVFLSYSCPECDFNSGELLAFSQHAIINHVLSNILFEQTDLGHIEESFSIENEAKLELEESDPLLNTNAESNEFDVYTLINQEVNVELESNKKKPRKEPLNIDSLRNCFPEASVNLESLSDELEKNGNFLKKFKSLKYKKKKITSDECGENRKKQGEKQDIDNFSINAQDIFRKSLNISSKVNLSDELEKNGKMLEKFKSLEQKKMKHEKKETVICEICGFKTIPHGLPQHVKMVHEKTFLCSYCELEYAHEYRLEFHIEANHPGTSELKYFCSECGDGFMFEKNMIKHSEKHKIVDNISDGKNENTNEKLLGDEVNAEDQKPDKINHLCSKCGQYFTSLMGLADHFFKEHKKLGEDFDCPMCPKMISTSVKSSVMDHIRSTHLNETKKCPDCKQTYKLYSYKKHRQKVHGVKYHLKRKGKPAPVPTSAGYECPDCKKILSTSGSKYSLPMTNDFF